VVSCSTLLETSDARLLKDLLHELKNRSCVNMEAFRVACKRRSSVGTDLVSGSLMT